MARYDFLKSVQKRFGYLWDPAILCKQESHCFLNFVLHGGRIAHSSVEIYHHYFPVGRASVRLDNDFKHFDRLYNERVRLRKLSSPVCGNTIASQRDKRPDRRG